MNSKATTESSSSELHRSDVSRLIVELEKLRSSVLAKEREFASRLAELPPGAQASGRNLLHYVELRRHDVRQLQSALARLGASSLGRSEAHVVENLDSVLRLLHALDGRPPKTVPVAGEPKRGADGPSLLEMRTQALLGERPEDRDVRVMVTMPSVAATDAALVRDLLSHGMDCMRINCAHDDAGAWARMLSNLDRARRDLGRSCRVLMDLAGPKLRTGEFEPGPAIVKWRPTRDVFGRVTRPARVWLTSEAASSIPAGLADASIPVSEAWLAGIGAGDRIVFVDTRGARRLLHVVERSSDGCWAECNRTAYVESGTRLRVVVRGDEDRVGTLPPVEQSAFVRAGESLLLRSTRDGGGKPAVRDAGGRVVASAVVECTEPGILADVREGERILFDDGAIEGIIRRVEPEGAHVEILKCKPDGDRIRSDKGINLPDSALNLESLTEKDREDLRFVANHADLVGQSFVRCAADVSALQRALATVGGDHIGVVLKIETRQAFEHLPSLLLSALRSRTSGVMIARGDLAAECGYERLAEIQEEILWMCEAAHLPVVWATQVLEQLAKTGRPSRAEITDAAMAERAECVMLNKGPYVLDALRTLNGILKRMQTHQAKKTSMLRHLRIADRFFEDATT